MGLPGRTRIVWGVVSAVTLAIVSVVAGGCAGDDGSSGGRRAGASCPVASAHTEDGRQVRAMWVSTVANIDWPSRPGLSEAKQKAQYLRLLDVAEKLNLNTVYVQIRPTADAFYPSPYEPWSKYLTGEQGRPPGYDPLKFLVSRTHARGMEFHAWFNPYRVSKQHDRAKLAADSPAGRHPDWVRRYGDELWYDPGLPRVRALTSKVVLDVVKKYDIDGVHFDDYFYPYPVAGEDFPDKATFEKYGSGFDDIGDWRRHNVDLLVKGLSARIHRAKPWVKFGISPFGVWRNKSSDPHGSDTKALQSYDEIYADTRRWVRKGWLDYIVPQLYWPIGFKAAGYRTLVDWWSEQVKGTGVQLVIGQAAYRVGHGGPWNDPAELSHHLAIDEKHPEVRGEAFFSARDLRADDRDFVDRIEERHFSRPALVPVMPALGGEAPAEPSGLRAEAGEHGVRLRWHASDATTYAVYRREGTKPGCAPADGHNLVAVIGGSKPTFVDSSTEPGATYTYAVTALDRLHHQSSASRGATVTTKRG